MGYVIARTLKTSVEHLLSIYFIISRSNREILYFPNLKELTENIPNILE